MYKKTLCLVLACVMILSCLSVVSAASDVFTLDFNDKKAEVLWATEMDKAEIVQKSADPVDNYYQITTLNNNRWPFYQLDNVGAFSKEFTYEMRLMCENVAGNTKELAQIQVQLSGDTYQQLIHFYPDHFALADYSKSAGDFSCGVWYRVQLHFDLRNGKYRATLWDDTGKQVAQTPFEAIPTKNGIDFTQASFQSSRIMAMNVVNETLSFDDIRIENVVGEPQAPTVTASIDGSPYEGQTLKATYLYSDYNDDPEDPALLKYQWQVSGNGTDFTDISGETGASYTLKSTDIGKYFRVQMQVGATVEPKLSEFTPSNAIGPVEENPRLDEQNYTRLDLSKSRTLYSLQDTGEKLLVFGTSAKGTYDLSEYANVRYRSNDTYVASVSENGTVTVKNPGIAIVTATVENPDGTKVSGNVIVNVYKDAISQENFNNYTVADPVRNNHLTVSTDIVRTGEQAIGYQIRREDSNPETAPDQAKWGMDIYKSTATAPVQAAEGWFYDNGTEESLASLYFESVYSFNNVAVGNTLLIRAGILDSKSKYYKVSNSATDRAKVGPGGVNVESGGYTGDNTFSATELDGTGGFPLIPRTKGWHQVVVVLTGGDDPANIGTENGTITLYLDGVKVFTENYAPICLHALRGEGLYSAGSANKSYYDDFAIYRYYIADHPPMVEEITVKGAAMVDSTLTAEASVVDLNGIPLAPTTYQWQRLENDAWVAITGADKQTYTCVEGDLGKQLRVAVTPHSTQIATPGETAYSEPTKAVISKRDPPSASGVSIEGENKVTRPLTLKYTYVKSANGDAEGATEFKWEYSTDGTGWTVIDTAVTDTYTPTANMAGYKVRATVTPIDVNGLAGTPVAVTTTLATEVPPLEFFVAADGDDSNDGSINRPFRTITKARDVVRTMKEGATAPIYVNIRGGVYPMSQTVNFTIADSGTEQAPIVYQAYNGEEVTFTGSQKIDNSRITKVTDSTVLNKVVDTFARTKLMQMDLSGLNIPYSEMVEYGFGLEQNYRPTEFYVNGKALSLARYPNDEPGTGYLRIGEVTADPDNYKEAPFTLQYEDETDRTEHWSAESVKDMWITGFIANDWAGVTHKVASLDAKKKEVTSVKGTPYIPAVKHRFYFFNLVEEIDMPGEYYLDRSKDILYFYPNMDMEGADVEVSVMDTAMIKLDSAKHLTFKNLNFEFTRATPITSNDVDHITLDGLTVAHTSQTAMTVYGTNSTVVNCHVYDTGSGGVTVSGGDRKRLVSGNDVIENNRIHSVSRVYNSYKPCISGGGVGLVIRNNKVYDGPHQLVALWGNDFLLEYNEIYNGVLDASDMAAVYWGRDPSQLGYTVVNNYFHHMGNQYGGFGQQAVFWDDGSPGPLVAGNVFYRATRTADQGGQPGNCYPLKTYGGQFSQIRNNVFVDVPSTFGPQLWNSAGKQINWWLWVNDKYELYQHDIWAKLKETVDFEAPEWVAHYKDSQWSYMYDLFSTAKHDEVKNKDATADKAALEETAAKYAPERTNVLYGNVAVNVAYNNNEQGKQSAYGYVDEQKTYRSASADGLFKDYGKDFTLTDEGMAKVKAVIPDFKNVEFDKMGLRSDIGGLEPSASNAVINGDASVGRIVTANYQYADPDGDHEGASEIVWYLSNAKGEFERILGKQDKELKIDSSYMGRKLRYTVTPHDLSGLYGETVTSQEITVAGDASNVDKSKLWEAIDKAEALLSTAVVGNEDGQYPQEAVDAMKAAIDKARAVAEGTAQYQYVVDDATAELISFTEDFPNLQNTTLEYQSLKPLLADTSNWVTAAGEDPTFENGSLIVPDGGCVSYIGSKYKNKTFVFNLKFEKKTEDAALSSAIYFRLSDPESRIWEHGNTGYLLWIKDDSLEYQKWVPGQDLIPLENNSIKAGTEHEIAIGVRDSANNKVKYELSVDGKLVYEREVDGDNLFGQEGYFGLSTEGAKMIISPVDVDKSALETQLSQAAELLASAVVGDGYGQYASTSALDTAIAAAKAKLNDDNLVTYDMEKAASALQRAMKEFITSANAEEDVTESKTIPINYALPTATFRIASGVDLKLQMDPAQGQPALTTETATPGGTVQMQLLRGTKLSGNNWNGLFQAPLYSTTPSKTISNAEISGVYKIGSANVVNADHAVRIVLPGQAGKLVAYLENGKYKLVNKTLSEDSQTKADAELLPSGGVRMLESGSDLVIWTTYLTEFVTYKKISGSNDDPPYIPTPAPGSTGGSYNPGSGSPAGGGITTPTPNSGARFVDTVGHWAQADIEEMAAKGIVTGVTSNTFEPERAITRAEFATLIVKALDINSSSSAGFVDVAEGDWHYSYVNAAANAGIIVGYDGWFRPDDLITREEMAVILVKSYNFLEKSASRGGIDKFADRENISDWAYEYVDEATTAGLISGMTEDTFAPAENTTRAQAASVIKRLLDQ